MAKETFRAYTKAERHKIYKEALRLYTMGTRTHGMCYYIEAAELNLYNRHFCCALYMIEFIELRPARVGRELNFYWWPKNDRQIRIENFKKIIDQTKPETNV